MASVAPVLETTPEAVYNEGQVLDFLEARIARRRKGGHASGALQHLDAAGQRLAAASPLFDEASKELEQVEAAFEALSPPGPTVALAVLMSHCDATEYDHLASNIFCLRPLRRVAAGGPHRLAVWSRDTLALVERAAEVDDAPALPPLPAEQHPGGGRWAGLDRIVAEARKRLQARLEVPAADVRAALLFAECLGVLADQQSEHGEDSGTGAAESFVISSLPEGVPAALKTRLAAEVEQADLVAKYAPQPRTVVALAKALRVPRPKLIAKVEAEAPPLTAVASPEPPSADDAASPSPAK